MSSDWGRNLSATRLRRAGGLSVSSGMSSVSWDSELSPPPITPPPLPPVNAPPDTIYVIRAKRLRYLLPSCVSSFSASRATRAPRGRRLSRPRDVRKMFERLRCLSTAHSPTSFPIFQTPLERHSNLSSTPNRTRRNFSFSFSLIPSLSRFSHLDLYAAVSAVALSVSGGFVALFPLLAAPPDEWAEPKHIRLNRGQAALLEINVVRGPRRFLHIATYVKHT